MPKITVLIVDDHAIVREGLCQLLSSQPDMEVVGEAEDGMEALKKVQELLPNVVLLDIALPRLSGIELASLLKKMAPKTHMVVFSIYKKEAYVQKLLNSGVLGYVLKASPSSEVLEAVRSAHRGEHFLSPKIREDVIKNYLKSHKEKIALSNYDLLTDREQQIFRLLVEGNSVKQISGLFHLSRKTVEKHKISIMKKVGVPDLVSLVKYAIKIGIIDPELWEE